MDKNELAPAEQAQADTGRSFIEQLPPYMERIRGLERERDRMIDKIAELHQRVAVAQQGADPVGEHNSAAAQQKLDRHVQVAQQGDGDLPPLNAHDQSVMEDIKAYADDRSERSTFWKRATAIAALRIIGDLRAALAQHAGSAKPSEQAEASHKPAVTVDTPELTRWSYNTQRGVFRQAFGDFVLFDDAIAHTARAVAEARKEVSAHQQRHIEQLQAKIAGHETMFDCMKHERDAALSATQPSQPAMEHDDFIHEFTLDQIVTGMYYDDDGLKRWRGELDEYIRVERNLAAPPAAMQPDTQGLTAFDVIQTVACLPREEFKKVAIHFRDAFGQQPDSGPSAPTDISKHLREYAANPGYSHNDYADVMRTAADECERFYGGMMNWKENAQKKDRTIIELRSKQSDSERDEAPGNMVVARTIRDAILCTGNPCTTDDDLRRAMGGLVDQDYALIQLNNERDAARYRMMKENDFTSEYSDYIKDCLNGREHVDLDAIVDAMAAQQGEKGGDHV